MNAARFISHGLAPVLACFFLVSLASAQQELFKLTASDGSASDRFGTDVAVGENTIVVGAPYDDDSGTNSGSAYLFDPLTGNEVVKLLPSDGAEFDQFGGSVAIAGGYAVIGARYDDDNGADSGSAYVFDGQLGPLLHKLTPADGEPGDSLGASVATDGNLVVVGAPHDDDNGSNSGSAYIFDATTGQELHKLVASDGSQGDQFGFSVAVEGGTVVVGAPYDAGVGSNSGSVYIFDSRTGVELCKLTASDAMPEQYLGCCAAISAGVAVVGAYGDSDNGASAGAAYIIDVLACQEVYKLVAFDGADGDKFGCSVDIGGALIVVGAREDDDNGIQSGSAYLYDAVTRTMLTKLTTSDGAQSDLFGNGVGTNGATTVIGAQNDDDNGSSSGSAYVFGVPDTDCNNNGIPDPEEIATGVAPDCNANLIPDECDIASGTSVDLDGNGIPDECDCSAINYCTAIVNSLGRRARMGWMGDTHISVNDFTLTVDDALPTQFGLFFYSDKQQLHPFGDGALCIGPGIQRISPVIITDQTGSVSRAIDFIVPPFSSGPFSISPYSTWSFQFWYRDPIGGPAGFNFSDGLEVTFCP